MWRPRARALILGGLAALGACMGGACTVAPVYEGDVVVGSFTFSAGLDLASSTCPALPDGGPASDPSLGFVGVYSLDSQSRKLFLRVKELDRQGVLGDRGDFALSPPFAVERDLGCSPLKVTETISGSFTGAGPRVSTCPLLAYPDAGCFTPTSLDGFVVDTLTPVDGGGVTGGPGCAIDAGPSCVFRYTLHGVRN